MTTAVERFPRVRQSLLARYADCALSTAMEMRASIADPRPDRLSTSGWSTHRQTGGTIAHAVIARALTRMLALGEERVPPEVVEDMLDVELTAPGGMRAAIPPAEVVQLRKTLRKWARDTEWTIDELAGVEIRMATDVQYDGPDGVRVVRTITGQLDVLLISADGHATVVDFKDTWALPPARGDEGESGTTSTDDGQSPGGFFQQRFYALLVFRTIPSVRSVTLREQYIRYSEPREATIWRDELPRLEAEFAALVARFDAAYDERAPDGAAVALRTAARGLVDALDGDGDDVAALDQLRAVLDGSEAPLHEAWPPSAGTHCRYCPKAQDCPIDPDLRGEGGLMSQAEAERAMAEYLRAHRVREFRRKQLETWCDRHGPIRVRDGKRMRFLGFVIATHTQKPSAAQVNAAVRAGRDPRTLYVKRRRSEFREFSPDGVAPDAFAGEDIASEFERAAEYVRAQRGRS